MSVILTSFRQSDKILKMFPYTKPFSVARYQPKGYVYPELKFLAAYNEFYKPLILGDDEHALLCFREDWLSYLNINEKLVFDWLEGLTNDEDIVLCCWCPKPKRKDLTFVCHTGIIGQVINNIRPDIQILMDEDRHFGLVSEFKPKKYKVIGV